MKGNVLLRIISADMLSVIKALTEAQITIYNIEEVSPIEFQIWIHIRSFNKTSRLLKKKGIEYCVLQRDDFLYRIKSIRKRAVILLCLCILIGCSIYLPTKVLFIEILGNEVVSDIRILETINKYGLFVGIDRAQIRSEEIKNHLLEDIPELNWAGVNTSGCLAVIQVLESDIQKQEESPEVSHIVAMSDGIIESCVVTRGRPLCKTGDAVKKGQILVSGYSDHHFLITATRSEGEVYAKTTKTVKAVMLLDTKYRTDEKEKVTNLFLIVDQKAYPLIIEIEESEKAIYEEKYVKQSQLTLPGNMKLPVWLREEIYVIYENTPDTLSAEMAERILVDYCEKLVNNSMICGKILSLSDTISCLDNIVTYNGIYLCNEMIGIEVKAEPYMDSCK